MTPLFDHALIDARRRRALAAGGGAEVLLDRVADELLARLSAVTRRFARALDLATPSAGLADRLESSGIADRVDRMDRIAEALLPGRVGRFVGDPEALPVAPASLDLVVSALALQAVDDLPGVLVQVRRALRPDGLFLAALLGGETLHELRTAFTEAEAEIAGGTAPRVVPFADLRDLGGLLQRAGFALPVADLERITVRYRDPFGLMRDLRAAGATNPLRERHRRPLRRAVLFRAAALYAERFADPDGRVRATFDVVSLSGWAPHESQQKPLRPGTAQARLADALRTAERPAGEAAGPPGPTRPI